MTIVEAGWRLLADSGPSAVQIDAVVAKVGISRTLFYKHFSDRIALLVALFERYNDELHARQRSLLNDFIGSMDDLISANADLYLDVVLRHGVRIRPLIEAAGSDARMVEARKRARAKLLSMWQPVLMPQAPPEFARRLERQPELLARMSYVFDIVVASEVEAADIILLEPAARDEVRAALHSVINGVAQRAIAALTIRGPGAPSS